MCVCVRVYCGVCYIVCVWCVCEHCRSEDNFEVEPKSLLFLLLCDLLQDCWPISRLWCGFQELNSEVDFSCPHPLPTLFFETESLPGSGTGWLSRLACQWVMKASYLLPKTPGLQTWPVHSTSYVGAGELNPETWAVHTSVTEPSPQSCPIHFLFIEEIFIKYLLDTVLSPWNIEIARGTIPWLHGTACCWRRTNKQSIQVNVSTW